MYPQEQLPPPQPAQPVVPQQAYGQILPPNTPGMSQPAPSEPDTGNRKLLYILIGSGVGLLIIIIVVVLLVGGSSTKKPGNTTSNAQQSSGPAPATSLTLQQNYDAINQQLSSLNDQTDFPASALSDTSLNN